jgi:endonuclease-3 related protein
LIGRAERRESSSRLRRAYDALLDAFGPQHWWPGDGPFEIMVGAVLTQNTSWRNVEHAMDRIRAAGAMDPIVMSALTLERLEELARPAGSFRRKARTLSRLSEAASLAPGGLPGLLSLPQGELRRALLAISGVGPETADSILVYAAGRPVFVVDAYARRFLERHGIATLLERYEDLQDAFEHALGRDADKLGECHALLVELGKRYCKPSPRCDECPLRYDLPTT